MWTYGNLLRVELFILVAFITMFLLGHDYFIGCLTLIIWAHGAVYWSDNQIETNQDDKDDFDKFLPFCWPVIVLFEWQTFDEEKGDFPKEKTARCRRCDRPVKMIKVLATYCSHVNTMPSKDGDFQSLTVKYCQFCDDEPRARQIICRHHKKCPFTNCPFRK